MENANADGDGDGAGKVSLGLVLGLGGRSLVSGLGLGQTKGSKKSQLERASERLNDLFLTGF